MLTRRNAKDFFADIEKLRGLATDAMASLTPNVYPVLHEDGQLIPVGTRINHNGTIKRAAVDLWDIPENSPEAAPSLWEDINYRDGYRIIPETITVGTAFPLNEYGWWTDGKLYKSLLDVNIYTPAQYPAGWIQVDPATL